MNRTDRMAARILPAVAVFVLSLGVFLPACAAEAKSEAMVKDGDVLAKIGDQSVTAGEVKQKAASDFEQLELRLEQCQAEYKKGQHDVLEGSVKKIVQDTLVDKEAAARGITKDALLAEATKDAAVTDADQEKFYEENKARIPPTMTKEQVMPQIKAYLEQQKQGEAREKFMTALEDKYKVAYLVEPMRVQVAADGFPSKGPANAPVTIVEFSDFECPFCSRLIPSVDEVVAKYGDKVRVVFRQFPLSFHQKAQKAAEASLCANDQGKFWALHDAMFQNQQALGVDQLKAKAAELGMKADEFNSCLDSGKHAAAVAADLKAGSAAGVSGTPAIFVNGRFLSGAVPAAEISKLVDDELKRKEMKAGK